MVKSINKNQILIANLNSSKYEKEGSEEGRWSYNTHFICYEVYPVYKGKKFEVALRKIQNILEVINSSSLHELTTTDISNIHFLRKLIQIKVNHYNSSHGFFYKLFSRILYGNFQTYEKSIICSINSIIEKIKKNSNNSDQSQANIFDREGFINEFTCAFLSPYIEGKINAKTDDPNRQPMIEKLLVQLEKKLNTALSSEQKKEIEELALKAYLKLSIHGAYRRLQINQAISFSSEMNNLALEQVLKKDFPYQQSGKIELKEKIARTEQLLVQLEKIIKTEQLLVQLKKEITPSLSSKCGKEITETEQLLVQLEKNLEIDQLLDQLEEKISAPLSSNHKKEIAEIEQLLIQLEEKVNISLFSKYKKEVEKLASKNLSQKSI
jgi:hypothetical protein